MLVFKCFILYDVFLIFTTTLNKFKVVFLRNKILFLWTKLFYIYTAKQKLANKGLVAIRGSTSPTVQKPILGENKKKGEREKKNLCIHYEVNFLKLVFIMKNKMKHLL